MSPAPIAAVTAMSEPDFAGIGRRLAALVYDLLLVIAILMLASAIGTLAGELLPGFTAGDPDAIRKHPLFQVWLVFAWWGYYALCWHNGGQTLGMKTWRLKLVSLKGPRLRLVQSLLRFFSAFGGLGLIYALIHPRGFSLQDLLSGSGVILLPKTRDTPPAELS